jgi:hypothetical protein
MTNKDVHILIEQHDKNCKCSYCYGENKLHFGINLPENKAWNSWRVFKIFRIYIRWTLSRIQLKG